LIITKKTAAAVLQEQISTTMLIMRDLLVRIDSGWLSRKRCFAENKFGINKGILVAKKMVIKSVSWNYLPILLRSDCISVKLSPTVINGKQKIYQLFDFCPTTSRAIIHSQAPQNSNVTNHTIRWIPINAPAHARISTRRSGN